LKQLEDKACVASVDVLCKARRQEGQVKLPINMWPNEATYVLME
jgi:hypothetical protein